MNISLCMIVKNEEEVLARCLESVKLLVDEIIIVDTGSTDKTVEIARAFTEKIYDFPWVDDFAKARNFSFGQATGDYILWLDADDYISPENAERFVALKDLLENELPDMVMCPYDVSHGGNAPLSTFYRERLVRRCMGFVWQGRVHECIAPRGKILHFDFRVSHLGSKKIRGARNLHIYQKWAAEEMLGGRDKFYYGRELYYNRLYTEAIAVLEDMLCGEGWYVNKIEACKILSYCYAAQGKTEQAKIMLFRSFLYGEPRACVLCELAGIYKKENKIREAAFWYECAIRCRDHATEGDFEEPTAHTLVPLVELTCCYFSLGDTEKSISRHKRAERLFPNHPAVIYNRKFFESQGLL